MELCLIGATLEIILDIYCIWVVQCFIRELREEEHEEGKREHVQIHVPTFSEEFMGTKKMSQNKEKVTFEAIKC